VPLMVTNRAVRRGRGDSTQGQRWGAQNQNVAGLRSLPSDLCRVSSDWVCQQWWGSGGRGQGWSEHEKSGTHSGR